MNTAGQKSTKWGLALIALVILLVAVFHLIPDSASKAEADAAELEKQKIRAAATEDLRRGEFVPSQGKNWINP